MNMRRENMRISLLRRCREQKAEIEQYFRDMAHYNRINPDSRIDPDPDGEMMRMKASISNDIDMLERDDPDA